MEINYQISQRKEVYLLIQFSQIRLILTKIIHHKLFYKFKEPQGRQFFFVEIQKLKFFQQCFFFQFPCVHYCIPIVSRLCLYRSVCFRARTTKLLLRLVNGFRLLSMTMPSLNLKLERIMMMLGSLKVCWMRQGCQT